MKTTKVTIELPNISDHRQVRNGVAGIAAFGLSCAGAVHFFSQTRYKEAFGAGVLSILSLGIAVDSLTSESKAETADPLQGQESEDLSTLCDAVETATTALNEDTELSELKIFKFKNPVIGKIWGNFQRALQHQKSQSSIESKTVVTLKSSQMQQSAALSPTSKAEYLHRQRIKPAETHN